MKLIFATNNPNKLSEDICILGNQFEVLSLADIGHSGDIPEPHATLEENAREKSMFIFNKYGVNCFSEDSGLEIDTLNGEPGVHSARYAQKDDLLPAAVVQDADLNMELVLKKMDGLIKRSARFRTIISLIQNGEEIQFEGQVEGIITKEKSGVTGFGYDPIFKPQGYDVTFAEMSVEQKNAISHRGNAIRKLVEYLMHLK